MINGVPCKIGNVGHKGYSWVKIEGKTRVEHRRLWEQRFGVLPSDLVLDHLCKNKGCIELMHLEPVTQSENTKRGFADWDCPDSKREGNRAQMQEMRKDPEFVEKIRQATNLPHHRDAQAERIRIRNSDPEFQKKAQEGKRRAAATRKASENGFEKCL